MFKKYILVTVYESYTPRLANLFWILIINILTLEAKQNFQN